MKRPQQINVLDLLYKIDNALIQCLKDLKPEQWSLQTLAPRWIVKDVALHLLDGNLRTLSMLRDNCWDGDPPNVKNYSELIAYLNKLNADWIKGTRRLSPSVIIDLLEQSGVEYCEFLASLPLMEMATFSVDWAGESESKNWFHIAREYTEKWHHQQQIRLAVGDGKTLLAEDWYFSYLDTSVRALPHHYREISGKDGDCIKFTFVGTREKSWFLEWVNSKWELFVESDQSPITEVRIKDELAWRIFTKAIAHEDAIHQSEIIGNEELGKHIFRMIAVMA